MQVLSRAPTASHRSQRTGHLWPTAPPELSLQTLAGQSVYSWPSMFVDSVLVGLNICRKLIHACIRTCLLYPCTHAWSEYFLPQPQSNCTCLWDTHICCMALSSFSCDLCCLVSLHGLSHVCCSFSNFIWCGHFQGKFTSYGLGQS